MWVLARFRGRAPLPQGCDQQGEAPRRDFHFGKQLLSYRKGLPFDSVADQSRRELMQKLRGAL
jgi:hypothetical protein